MITITLTEKQLKALQTALSELWNSGDWAQYYSEAQIEEIQEVEKLINQTKNK